MCEIYVFITKFNLRNFNKNTNMMWKKKKESNDGKSITAHCQMYVNDIKRRWKWNKKKRKIATLSHI